MSKKKLEDQTPQDSVKNNPDASQADVAITDDDSNSRGVTSDLVAFSLSDRLFGVEITKIQEVVRHGDITRVPLVAKYVKGVMNLRGNITPVIDLYTRFSLPATEIGNTTRIIVVSIRDQAVGFIVDQVSRIISVTDSDMEDVSNFGNELNAEYIEGVVKIKDSIDSAPKGELLLKLDLEGVFNDSMLNQSLRSENRSIESDGV